MFPMLTRPSLGFQVTEVESVMHPQGDLIWSAKGRLIVATTNEVVELPDVAYDFTHPVHVDEVVDIQIETLVSDQPTLF
jgi:hypothetical protein